MNTKRVTAGVPTGGQFAATGHAESGVTLGASPTSTASQEVDPWAGYQIHEMDGSSGRDTITLVVDDDGKICDGPDGTAAEMVHRDGHLISERHLDGEVLIDRADGTPGLRTFHPDGSVESERRAGSAEVVRYPPGTTVSHSDPRDGSTVSTAATSGGGRVTQRVRPATGGYPSVTNDGPGGEPGITYIRSNGSVSSQTHYRSGVMGETLDYFGDGSVAAHFACSACDRAPCTCEADVAAAPGDSYTAKLRAQRTRVAQVLDTITTRALAQGMAADPEVRETVRRNSQERDVLDQQIAWRERSTGASWPAGPAWSG